jgi:sodium/pantothenate symporter
MSVSIALWARKTSARQGSVAGFLEEYFIGNRSMGGFVLSMTIVTTYISASSFIGGPGMAYKLGLGWVLLAMIQVPTTFLTLGVLGKRFAIITRRIGSMTITDLLRTRYNSDFLVIITAIAMISFFMALMLAQFKGGAHLFQTVTGYSYEAGLIIFGLSVVIYTAVGGFRGTVLTDALQGIVMLIASVIILFSIIKIGGGVENCINTLKQIDPGLIAPTGANDAIPQPMILSFWILVGLGVLGLPQTVQKCMGYKDSKSMHNAMLIGTLSIGFMLLCVHLAGALGRAVIPDIENSDLAMPTFTVRLLHPILAGVFIAGPLAAITSTVNTMLLMSCGVIIKDLYIHYVLKGNANQTSQKTIRIASIAVTLVIGIIVFIAALNPPDLLVWINLFAFGGLEATFLFPILLGIYWKKANAAGAVLSVLTGVSSYIMLVQIKAGKLASIFGAFGNEISACKQFMGAVNPIVPTLFAAFLAFALGAALGKKPDQSIINLFWGITEKRATAVNPD